MKTSFRIVVIVVLVLVIGFILSLANGAQDRQRLPGLPVYPIWSTVQPAMGPNGEPVHYLMKFQYAVVALQPSGEVEPQILGQAETDLLSGTKGVFIGTDFYPDRLVARLNDLIAMRVYREHFPTAPEDDERVRLVRP